MAEISKLERLLDLMAVLMDTRLPLTLRQIMDRLPVGAYPASEDESARRMFIRDRDDLASLGIAVVMELNPEFDVEGYRIDPTAFGTAVPPLEPDESVALSLALAVMGTEVSLWEVGGGATDDSPTALIPRADVPIDEDVRVMLDAVTGSSVLTFGYRGEQRVVEPHQVAFVKGNWQVTGHDRLRGEIRQFRKDRIEGAVSVTGEQFDPPAETRGVQADHLWRVGAGDPVDIRVLVDARHAAWVEGFLGPDSVVDRRGDGSVVVVESVRDFPAFRGFILTFLDGAEVLGPEEVRADMVAWLEGMAS